MKVKKKLLQSKFNSDLLWNVASFGLIALIGILINIIIIKFFDTATLGVFNQVYAIYILLSQLAVGGVHLSVQRYIPKYASSRKEHHIIIISSALLLSAITSLIIIALAYFLKDLPGKILGSENVTTAFIYTAWGLLFFSFNKVLLSYLNGCRRMKAFAVFQLLRFVFMFSGVVFIIALKFNGVMLASVLAFSELFLFVLVILYTINLFRIKYSFIRFKKWLNIHYKFGNRALLGNFLLDVNTKVDVFILGTFLTDSVVGVYSFASTFAEGFFQLPTLFRNNINPILTRLSIKNNTVLTTKIINRSINTFYKILGLLALTSVLLFPILFFLFSISENRIEIWLVYSILVIGMAVTSGYQPFLMIFNQFGMPLKQTYFILFIFLSNVIFNLILVPVLGLYGAALGTAIAMFTQVVCQKIMVKKHLHISF